MRELAWQKNALRNERSLKSSFKSDVPSTKHQLQRLLNTTECPSDIAKFELLFAHADCALVLCKFRACGILSPVQEEERAPQFVLEVYSSAIPQSAGKSSRGAKPALTTSVDQAKHQHDDLDFASQLRSSRENVGSLEIHRG